MTIPKKKFLKLKEKILFLLNFYLVGAEDLRVDSFTGSFATFVTKLIFMVIIKLLRDNANDNSYH
jgi:hypothetical protein